MFDIYYTVVKNNQTFNEYIIYLSIILISLSIPFGFASTMIELVILASIQAYYIIDIVVSVVKLWKDHREKN